MTTTKSVARKTATTTRKTATRKTATATKKAVANDVIFTNVKDIASHYYMTAKNVRRILRQNKTDLSLDKHQKNAIYVFDVEQSNAIKTFFDNKYAKKEVESESESK